jgi:hypothetical protein
VEVSDVSRSCTVCTSTFRAAVDDALVAGRSQQDISAETGLHAASIQRHRVSHLSPALVAVQQRREERRSVRLVDRLDRVVTAVEKLVHAAEADGSSAKMLAAAREFRSGVELLARLTGELDERPQIAVVNVMASAEVAQMASALLAALAPFPEARIAAAQVLDVEDVTA